MIRIALLMAVLNGCASAFGAEPATDAAYVLPGDYSQGTTIAQFQARYGKDNVRIGPLSDAADAPRGLVLFPDDPSRRAYVAFHDEEALSDVASIVVRDRDSRWRGKQGVHVGMSFADLRQANRKPFYFSGFDDAMQGMAHDAWSPALDGADNALGALDVAESEHMYFGVGFGPRPGALPVPADAFPHDEVSVSSDDPHFPRLGELFEVTEIRVSTSLDDEWE
jgi:hypothetical protein